MSRVSCSSKSELFEIYGRKLKPDSVENFGQFLVARLFPPSCQRLQDISPFCSGLPYNIFSHFAEKFLPIGAASQSHHVWVVVNILLPAIGKSISLQVRFCAAIGRLRHYKKVDP